MTTAQGTFVYPPPERKVNFNANDTIDVSWESYSTNSTPCAVSTFVWSESEDGGAKPWQEVQYQIVPCNGTLPIVVEPYGSANYFLAQFNFNYTSESDGYIKYLSQTINFNNEAVAGESATTWSLPASSTTSTTSSSSTGVSVITVTASSSVTPTTTSGAVATAAGTPDAVTVSTSQDKGLATGSIVGIVVGVVGGALIVLCAIWLFLRRRRRQRREAAAQKASAHEAPNTPHSYPYQHYPEHKSNKDLVELPAPSNQQELVGSPAIAEKGGD